MHAVYSPAIYLHAHARAGRKQAKHGAAESADLCPPGVLHHVVTGNYFIVRHAYEHSSPNARAS